MNNIGKYEQLTGFTSKNAGTSEWCTATWAGNKYFIKKMLSPVYPSKDLGLPSNKLQSRLKKFHATENAIKSLYQSLRDKNTSGVLVIPAEVITYQYHLCTVTDFISGNLDPDQVCQLSPWQRVVLMRTLTLGLMNVHEAGIVHSDVKMENILIEQNPQSGHCALKVIDFDGSFLKSAPPNAENVRGSMEYWAPEFFEMERKPDVLLTEKIDVFALGIVFHELWAGKKPAARNPKEYIGKSVLEGREVALDVSLPNELRTIIGSMLEADPEKRTALKSVYNGLEVLLKMYQVKIVNLQPKTPIPSPSPKPAVRPVSVPKDMPSSGAAPASPKVKEVKVVYRTYDGTVVETHIEKIPYGTSRQIMPSEPKGYSLVNGKHPIEVTVNSKGEQDKICAFLCEKKRNTAFGGLFKELFILLFLWLLVPLFTHVSYLGGEWEIARVLKQINPLYSVASAGNASAIETAATSDDIIMSDGLGYDNCSRLLEPYNEYNNVRSYCFRPEKTAVYKISAGAQDADGVKMQIREGNGNVMNLQNTGEESGSLLLKKKTFEKEYRFKAGEIYRIVVDFGWNEKISLSITEKH